MWHRESRNLVGIHCQVTQVHEDLVQIDVLVLLKFNICFLPLIEVHLDRII
jgi:hypothetical protein